MQDCNFSYVLNHTLTYSFSLNLLFGNRKRRRNTYSELQKHCSSTLALPFFMLLEPVVPVPVVLYASESDLFVDFCFAAYSFEAL